MPSVEQSLYAILTGGSPNAVADLVGTRIYHLRLPQNPTYPAIRLQRISTPRAQYRDLTGRSGYASPRMQIDCWALSPSGASELAQAVFDLLEGYRATVSGLRIDAISTDDEGTDVEADAGPDVAPVYRQRLDMIVYHAE